MKKRKPNVIKIEKGRNVNAPGRKPVEGHGMTFAKLVNNEKAKSKYLELLSMGATLGAAAKKVGISSYMFREYFKKCPEFADRVQQARLDGFEKLTIDIEYSLARQAKRGNVTACLAWLYCMAPHKWRDMRTFTLKGVEDVLRLIAPDIAKEIRPLLTQLATA